MALRMTSLTPNLFLASLAEISFFSNMEMIVSSETVVEGLPFLMASLSSKLVLLFTTFTISLISFSTSSDMFMSPR